MESSLASDSRQLADVATEIKIEHKADRIGDRNLALAISREDGVEIPISDKEPDRALESPAVRRSILTEVPE